MIQAQKDKTKKLLITQMPVSVTDQKFAISNKNDKKSAKNTEKN